MNFRCWTCLLLTACLTGTACVASRALDDPKARDAKARDEETLRSANLGR